MNEDKRGHEEGGRRELHSIADRQTAGATTESAKVACFVLRMNSVVGQCTQ